MGRKSRMKQERKEAGGKQKIVVFDEKTGKDHPFSPQQIRVVSEMLAAAREQGKEMAAMEFVNWVGMLKDIKGIGEQRAKDITNHFLKYGPGAKREENE
jgi:hypothetical protein